MARLRQALFSAPVYLSIILGSLVLLAALASSMIASERASVPTPPHVFRFAVALPLGDELAFGPGPSLAVSPDGGWLAYVARRSGPSQLFLRRVDEFEAVAIAGTEGASNPFFSPEGQWVGFFAAGKLKKVSVSRGPPATLCDAPNGRGASWGPDDTIVFAPGLTTGLSRIPASGGTPEVLTTPDAENGEFGHHWPEILPDGRAVLFTVDMGGGFDNARIAVQSLDTGAKKILLEGGTAARYARTGQLVYAREETLLAVPFDLERLTLTGRPVPILEHVAVNSFQGVAQFSFSKTGLLVYIADDLPEAKRRLVWVNRKGEAEPLPAPERGYFLPRLSPDGQRVAVIIDGSTYDVWIYELKRNTLTQLTSGPGPADAPTWTPDAKRVAFCAKRNGRFNLYWQLAGGSGPEERLLAGRFWHFPSSFSPDGQVLAFAEYHPPSGWDIWVLPLEREPQLFLRTPFHEGGAAFSPDGSWLAYISLESGRSEVYVQPFPGPGRKWRVTTEGGTEPVWSRNGRELFYRHRDKMMVVPIGTSPTFSAETPRLLFEGPYQAGFPGQPNYDVTRDGQRFLMIQSEWEPTVTKLNVVLNWFEEIKCLVSESKK